MTTSNSNWIVSNFHSNMIRRWILLVLLSNIGTSLITIGIIRYQNSKATGEYFYVPQQTTGSPIIVDPMTVERQDIVLPPVLVALGVGLIVSMLAGVLFSRQVTGPLYRIRETMGEVAEREPVAAQ